jgi:aspartate ammonia-lyase
MNINEVVANVANCSLSKDLGTYSPIHPNDDVNLSQSTNDGFPTAMRLAILEESKELVDQLRHLSRAFAELSWKNRDVPKSARTHLQDAVPMRLGQEFGAYAATCERLSRWFDQARNELRELGIGGSAAGTALNVPLGFREAVIQELMNLTHENLRGASDLFEAMQSQAPASFYSAILKTAALELTRICNDLRLLASGPMTCLAEITLPAVQPGSSIMPGKVNPSILEMCNQTWFSVLGLDQTVSYAMQAGQLELNVMMPIMADSLLQATTIMSHALHTLRTRCVEGIEANTRKTQHYFESTPQVATALSPKLGYDRTAKLVQEALKEHQSVLSLVREKKLLTEGEIEELLRGL